MGRTRVILLFPQLYTKYIINKNLKRRLNNYDTLNANLLNGTDGTTFPPFRTRDQIVYAYNADMCR